MEWELRVKDLSTPPNVTAPDGWVVCGTEIVLGDQVLRNVGEDGTQEIVFVGIHAVDVLRTDVRGVHPSCLQKVR